MHDGDFEFYDVENWYIVADNTLVRFAFAPNWGGAIVADERNYTRLWFIEEAFLDPGKMQERPLSEFLAVLNRALSAGKYFDYYKNETE
ncbi:MAG: hypothetical protein ACK53T_12745 [Planctomycetota bacterium]